MRFSLVQTEACRAYDSIIEKSGGIDLQLLGLGLDGHIGFNEPADHFPVGTHCVELSESTIEANQRFFERRDEVPKKAYTMGIGAIMQAEKVLMIANGSKKAGVVKRAFFGLVTPEVPASILQLHRNATVLLDEEAAEEVKGLLEKEKEGKPVMSGESGFLSHSSSR